jgi:hypothetical protein
VEDAPDHTIPHLGDALHDVLDRQTERQKTGILDLDPVTQQSNVDGRALLAIPTSDEVPAPVIKSNLKTADPSRSGYFRLLEST